MVVVFAGCASLRGSDVRETEQRLAAAGFKVQLANTPAKLAHLRTLPQHIIRRLQRNGTISYVYADADGCTCLYVGDAKAHQNYEQIKLDELEAEEDKQQAMADQDASIINYDAGWDAWGVDAW